MRKIYGLGVNDANYKVQPLKDGRVDYCPFYKKWHSMMKRAYCEKHKKQRPSYNGVTVCKEWHSFMAFRKWMETQNWKGKELDKDILKFGNKEYSPENCVFVSGPINSFFLDCTSVRGRYPVGVYWDALKAKFKGQCRNPLTGKNENLGSFDNPDDAHKAWKKRKYELACLLASEQEDSRVAKSMIERYKYE